MGHVVGNTIRIFVTRLEVRDHPTDPNYQIGKTMGMQVVTGKHYLNGALGLFIPADCIVPESLLREMWLWNEKTRKGRLGGAKGNKVIAKTMAGFLSQGLFYGKDWHDCEGVWHRSSLWQERWKEGDDVTAETGIVVPPSATEKVWLPPPQEITTVWDSFGGGICIGGSGAMLIPHGIEGSGVRSFPRPSGW